MSGCSPRSAHPHGPRLATHTIASTLIIRIQDLLYTWLTYITTNTRTWRSLHMIDIPYDEYAYRTLCTHDWRALPPPIPRAQDLLDTWLAYFTRNTRTRPSVSIRGVPYHEYAYTTFARHEWPTLRRIRVRVGYGGSTYGVSNRVCNRFLAYILQRVTFSLLQRRGIITHNATDGWMDGWMNGGWIATDLS